MKIRTWAALLAGVTGLVLAGAAPAGAATPGPQGSPGPGGPPDLSAARAAVTARIDARLHTLDGLKNTVAGATNLTAAHRTTLSSLISSDTAGLTALRARVAADQTGADLRADERSMIVDYRIYLLVVPKVRFTVAADAEHAVITKLRGVRDVLAAAVAKDKAAGHDVSKQEAELADMATQLDAAQAALAGGQLDALLAQQPSPDADALAAVVGPARTMVHTTRVDLRKAVTDGKQVRDQLR